MRFRSRLDVAIAGACALFIGILVFSGFIEHEVLVLHLFQSLIYVAAIALSLNHSKWGYAIGISKAFIWNLYNTFSGFVFHAGFKQWSLFLHGRRITNPVQFIAPVAYLDHLVLIVLMGWAYARLRNKRWSDIVIFLTSLVAVTAYFLLIIAASWPQFLPQLARRLGISTR